MERHDMMKRMMLEALLVVFGLGVVLTGNSLALTVGGSVSHPLNVGVNELAKLESVETRVAELTRDSSYSGVFIYKRGSPQNPPGSRCGSQRGRQFQQASGLGGAGER